MAVALLVLLIGIYLAIGIRVKSYTKLTRLVLLGVSAAIPGLFYFLL